MVYRVGAQKFANEVFATVLGYGWFYEVISGQKDAVFKNNFPNYEQDPDYVFQDLEIKHTEKFFDNQDIKKSVRSVVRSGELGILASSTLLSDKVEFGNNQTNMFLLSVSEAQKMPTQFKKQIEFPIKIQKEISKGKTGLWKWKNKKCRLLVIGISLPEKLSETFKNDFN